MAAHIDTTIPQQDHIQVLIRPRPFLQRELGDENVIQVVSDSTLILEREHDHKGQFSFDKVFTGSASQEEVYEHVQDHIEAVLDGVNCTVFAYGQTGTGKTYTMLGLDDLTGVADKRAAEAVDESCASEDRRGIIPHAMDRIFAQIQREQEDADYKLVVSYLEIYNEKLYDLLQHSGGGGKRELAMYEDKRYGTCVQGVSKVPVESATDIFNLMQKGQRHRAVSATGMNDQSSRSHTILQLFVEKTILENKRIRRAQLNLVDLAGSEKWDAGAHGIVADAKEIKELTNINQSLSALGNCISALSQKGRKHIPYRDSKLTRLLKDSLGGNTRTTFIATVSPAHSAIEESLQTLKFMERTKKIELEVFANEERDEAEVMAQYAEEMAYMREMAQLQAAAQYEEVCDQVDALEEDNTALADALTKAQLALHVEREERTKLAAVFQAALHNIRNAAPGTKVDAATQAEMDRLRAENAYLTKALEMERDGAPELELRALELAEYQEWLLGIDIVAPSEDSKPMIEIAQRMSAVEGALKRKQEELLATKKQFATFLGTIQDALAKKTKEVSETKAAAQAARDSVQPLQARITELESALQQANEREEPTLSRAQLLALLEKEAGLKRTRDTLLTLFSEFDGAISGCMSTMHTLRSYSALGTAKAAIVDALQALSDELHRLEDRCFSYVSEPSFVNSPFVRALNNNDEDGGNPAQRARGSSHSPNGSYGAYEDAVRAQYSPSDPRSERERDTEADERRARVNAWAASIPGGGFGGNTVESGGMGGGGGGGGGGYYDDDEGAYGGGRARASGRRSDARLTRNELAGPAPRRTEAERRREMALAAGLPVNMSKTARKPSEMRRSRSGRALHEKNTNVGSSTDSVGSGGGGRRRVAKRGPGPVVNFDAPTPTLNGGGSSRGGGSRQARFRS